MSPLLPSHQSASRHHGGSGRAWVVVSALLGLLCAYTWWGKLGAERNVLKLRRRVKEMTPQLHEALSMHHEFEARHERSMEHHDGMRQQIADHTRAVGALQERLLATGGEAAEVEAMWGAQLEECRALTAHHEAASTRLRASLHDLEEAHRAREADWHALLGEWKERERRAHAACVRSGGGAAEGAGGAGLGAQGERGGARGGREEHR
ncbi:hypothetical protein FOA52_015399 [Chlamydomonas sp. UWO 241]|nr:hypothetical protein FOA52_015399 [Chlamydomonas sp. UWO 241]